MPCRVGLPLQYNIQDRRIKRKQNQDKWNISMGILFFCEVLCVYIFIYIFFLIPRVINSPDSLYLPIFDLPSMLTFTSWGMKEGLGRVKGGSSSDFSTFRPSGADHLRFLLPGGLLEPASVLLATWHLERDPLSRNMRSPFSTFEPPPLPFPLLPLPRWLIPFSRSLCLEFPPLQLWGASETALGVLRCPWLRGGTEVWVLGSRGWVFFRDPFLRFLRVREIQTSPTESLEQGSSRSWVVRSGQHEDQPWPKTKKGYSNKTSTLTWRTKNLRELKLISTFYNYLQCKIWFLKMHLK